MLRVEVVYALPQQQTLIRLELPAGSTVRQAVEASRLLRKYPEIDLGKNKLGIYGKLTKPDMSLRAHDRIEVYRPLLVDPKEARRQRATSAKTQSSQPETDAGAGV